MTLGKDDRDYLRSLVRMDLRKKQRTLDKFAPRAGQSAADADAMRAKFEHNIAFRQGVLARLTSADVDDVETKNARALDSLKAFTGAARKHGLLP